MINVASESDLMSRVDGLLDCIEGLCRASVEVADLTDFLGISGQAAYQTSVKFGGILLTGIGTASRRELAAQKALSELLERVVQARLVQFKVIPRAFSATAVHRTLELACKAAKQELFERICIRGLLTGALGFKSISGEQKSFSLADGATFVHLRTSNFLDHRVEYTEIVDRSGAVLGNGFCMALPQHSFRKADLEAIRRYRVAISSRCCYSKRGVSKRRPTGSHLSSTEMRDILRASRLTAIQLDDDVYFACYVAKGWEPFGSLKDSQIPVQLRKLFASHPTLSMVSD